MLVEMGLERAPTGWYQDARSTPARCCPAGEMHPSPGPPDRRSRSGMCSMVRTAGGVDCPDLGSGGLVQGCTTRDLQTAPLTQLTCLMKPFPIFPFHHCFSPPLFSQIKDPPLVTLVPAHRGRCASQAEKVWK